MKPARVTTIDAVGVGPLRELLASHGLRVAVLAADAAIPGSYWGAPEAGLVGDTLYLRPDTPLHSALHEAAHYICMDAARRASLDTDAGGSFEEENAVCYLQILLADAIPGMGRERMFADMDAWGYTFRLGSARRWFEADAAEVRSWLAGRGLLVAILACTVLLGACSANPRAPESSCMQRTVDSLALDGNTDLRKHCLAAGAIAIRCGGGDAFMAGYAKEIADAFGPGDASRRDLAANRAGRGCAQRVAGEQGLQECCAGMGY